MKYTNPAAFCEYIVYCHQLVLFGVVVAHKSCVRLVPAVELVTVYSKLSSRFVPVVNETTVCEPLVAGLPEANTDDTEVNP